MLLRDDKSPATITVPVLQGRAGFNPKTVELIAIRAGGQPFGLLLKQIFNIARPDGDIFSVILSPDQGKGYSEILYRGQLLPVVELARKLQTGQVEALADSKILISGRLGPGGNIEQPFGIRVDEIIGVWHIDLENLRLLDEWVCRKRLGRLIWGIALVDRAKFGLQERAADVQPAPRFNDILSEKGFLPGSTFPDRQEPKGNISREESRLAMAGSGNSAEIPMMLLDLAVLRTDLYRD